MTFGAVIKAGLGQQLSDALYGSLVEVRIDMDLSEPTRFALRFEDDICGGDSKIISSAELDGGRPVWIFTKENGAETGRDICLVSGYVTEIKTSSMLGGSGSWVEVRGVDRRIAMDRESREGRWTGSAKDAASAIIEGYQFDPVVGDTPITYDERQNTLNQRGTDLAFLEDIARRNSMEMWITYTNEGTAVGSVTETFHLDRSPQRNTSASLPSIPVLVPELLTGQTGTKTLTVNPALGQCATVHRFKVDIDFEKPTAARGFNTPATDAEKIVEEIVNPTDPLDGWAVPDDLEGFTPARNTTADPSPTQAEAELKRDALVYEQSWFVTAEGSTTPRLAGFTPLPHQIVEVANNGEGLSGAYQVMSAAHVITADEHYVDFKARANGLRDTSMLRRAVA